MSSRYAVSKVLSARARGSIFVYESGSCSRAGIMRDPEPVADISAVTAGACQAAACSCDGGGACEQLTLTEACDGVYIGPATKRRVCLGPVDVEVATAETQPELNEVSCWSGKQLRVGHASALCSQRSAVGSITPLSLGCHTRRITISGVSDHHRDPERGALSLMIVVLFAVLMTLAGLVVDGGAKLTADENAVALAQEAARAGATTVDVSNTYASGSFVVDKGQALDAARQYLLGAGCDQFTLQAVGTRSIRVSVTITEPTKFLSLIGIDSYTSTGTATASLVTGVTGGT